MDAVQEIITNIRLNDHEDVGKWLYHIIYSIDREIKAFTDRFPKKEIEYYDDLLGEEWDNLFEDNKEKRKELEKKQHLDEVYGSSEDWREQILEESIQIGRTNELCEVIQLLLKVFYEHRRIYGEIIEENFNIIDDIDRNKIDAMFLQRLKKSPAIIEIGKVLREKRVNSEEYDTNDEANWDNPDK